MNLVKALIAWLDHRQLFSRLRGLRTAAARRAGPLRSAGSPKARLRCSERGQTLIEFAFVMPIIFVFIVLLVDFGIAIDRREVLQHAVREGARNAAVGNDVTTVQDYTSAQSETVLAPADVSVCYVDNDGDGVAGNIGDNVRVSAAFTYKFSVGSFELLSAFGVPQSSMSIPMTPSADMRLEKSVAGGVTC
jgi:hypothetical protein